MRIIFRGQLAERCARFASGFEPGDAQWSAQCDVFREGDVGDFESKLSRGAFPAVVVAVAPVARWLRFSAHACACRQLEFLFLSAVPTAHSQSSLSFRCVRSSVDNGSPLLFSTKEDSTLLFYKLFD